MAPHDIGDAMSRYPSAVLAEYGVLPPNPALTLHSGGFHIRQGRVRTILNGTVKLHWLPSPEVRFQGSNGLSEPSLDLDSAVIHTPGRGVRGEAVVLNHRIRQNGHHYAGILQGPVLVGARRAVNAIRFQLLNFPSYLANPVRFDLGDKPLSSRARLEFVAGDWLLKVDQVPDCEKRLKRVRAEGGFAATHACELTKRSGQRIPFEEGSTFLTCLHFFFGFLAGQWAGPVLASGQGVKAPVWRLYGSWKVAPRGNPRSWLPHHEAPDVCLLLESFCELYQKQLWARPIRTLVHLYVHANAESRTTEAALIAAFIPLELLSWLVVVEDGQHMSANKFDDLDTALRIDELLKTSGIPSRIPRELTKLGGSDLARTHRSGPKCLTKVRNALMHPRKTKRDFLAGLDPLVVFELKELALSYLELGFLSALGYKGQYARRIFKGWKGEDLAPVPWV